MVNEETHQLLTLLKQTDGPVSGTTLARQLGVSRVALWKRFEALRAAGYVVEADRRGYRLKDTDKPLPWEFPGDEANTFYYDSLGSTMDEALRLGLGGLNEGVVVAETQTAGRGRDDRRWQSEPGNLLVTLVLRPKLPVAYAGALGLEALAALADTVDELYGLGLTLKWPNDLMADGKKVAGLLIEAWGPCEAPRFYTVGLGLNVHAIPAVGRPVTSLDALGRGPIDRRALLVGWRRRLSRWSSAPLLEPHRWARVSPLAATFEGETFEGQWVRGTPVGYGRNGSLLVQQGEVIVPLSFGATRQTHGVFP